MIGAGENGGTGGGGVLKKGPWTGAEDEVLIQYVRAHGEGNWNAVQKHSGLNRCGKSCRLRWANHLRPNLKKGSFSPDEERLILELHSKYGNKWARMATQLPGRTDNEIKNYWNTRVKRRKRQGLPLYPNDINQNNNDNSNNNNNNNHQILQIQSPTTITSSTTTATTTTTATPPITPTNFPFHYLSPTTTAGISPAPAFSFQFRPVPLLSVPPPSFAGFSYDGGQSSAASSHMPSPAAVTPESHFHHHHHHQGQQMMTSAAAERVQQRHLQHHCSGGSSGGLLDDILDNLLDENHTSTEMVVKGEGKEHMNGLPEDLSKFLNFAPTNQMHHVAPPHWYNQSGSGEITPEDNSIGVDMQQLATYFPAATSEAASAATTPTTNYSGQNPATWDTLPGIGKGWFKHN